MFGIKQWKWELLNYKSHWFWMKEAILHKNNQYTYILLQILYYSNWQQSKKVLAVSTSVHNNCRVHICTCTRQLLHKILLSLRTSGIILKCMKVTKQRQWKNMDGCFLRVEKSFEQRVQLPGTVNIAICEMFVNHGWILQNCRYSSFVILRNNFLNGTNKKYK